MHRKNLLILDDDPHILRVLGSLLRSPHWKIVTCEEIEAAESLINHMFFDVVISDLNVSDLGGLEGMRLIRYIASNFPETTVLIFSGLVDEQVQRMGDSLGVHQVLRKPTDLRRLREIVQSFAALTPDPASSVDGQILHAETLDQVLASEGITPLLQPIANLNGEGEKLSTFAVEGLIRGPQDSILFNPEILLSYASMKQRLFEIETLCISQILQASELLPDRLPLFINVRPRTLTGPAFVDELIANLDLHGYKPNQVVLELTEQQSIVNPRAFAKNLDILRQLGFRIALDDYGEGFANLHLVLDLKPDFLKICGTLCRDIDKDPRKQVMVRSTQEMAKGLGIPTIMEQVETREELSVIRSLGIDYAQGYFLARPQPAEQLLTLEYPL